MSILLNLIKDYESVSFIGMCKNAGKTTTMNRIIRELKDEQIKFAATTVGRDGESNDLVTNTVKPGIFIYKGAIIATAADLLKYCDITKEILDTTGIYTPMGQVIMLRALSDGFVQLAGPSITTQLAQINQKFRSCGVEKILIDGALGRKSLCTKKVSDSTILCTGASYHKSMAKVVADTAYTCALLELPKAIEDVESYLEDANDRKYIPMLDTDLRQALYAKEDKLTPEKIWRKGADLMPEKIIVQGGLTDAMLRPLLQSGAEIAGKKLVVRDGSRILLTPEMYEKLQIKGLGFEVMDAIRLLAITVNPFSAYGFHFDKHEFRKKMSEAVNVPVVDVRNMD